MNCYYHPGVVAVGICKSCGKGVCVNCAVDLGKGLACRGRCEEHAAAVISMIDLGISQRAINQRLLGRARSNSYVQGSVMIALGLTFATLGLYNIFAEGFGIFPLFFLLSGVIFLVYGIFAVVRAATLPRVTDKKP